MAKQQITKQSRNGKKPVEVVGGVTVKIDGQTFTAKGPKGELTRTFRPEVVVSQNGGNIEVRPAENVGQAGLQYQGLTRALVANMILGVSEGYKRSLDFRGVGYRAEFKNNKLKMTVGLSHTPILDIPENVKVKVEQIDEAGTKFPRVHLESTDKEVIGRVAARIRSMRPPEPYKLKGVRYTGEKLVQKAGKSGKGA